MHETRDLLVEIGTEELPPKALRRLAAGFADAIINGLDNNDLKHGVCQWFATPRRMAVLVPELVASGEDQEIQRRGPAQAAAFDEAGNPTRAAQGFAKSCGAAVADLQTLETDKGAWLVYQYVESGKPTVELLQGIIATALARLPIPKRMRWGDSDAEFVRPVHWSVVLYGEEVVPCKLLGVTAGNRTRGHRYHHPDEIEIAIAGEYRQILADKGFVIADFNARQELIKSMVEKAALECGGHALIDPDLLEEVTSLVEWPAVIAGSFDKEFLQLPREVLIASMQGNQKYFPILDSNNELIAGFITIANINSTTPDEIKQGNERVIRPRLSDAAFFWRRDCARPLASYSDGLAEIIFQQQLGTLQDKTERVTELAGYIAVQLHQDNKMVVRAAALAKCDLLTDMVGEFPELQGTMGRYYALAGKEQDEVARALEEQYMPRQGGGLLPTTCTGRILAIADRLDTLVGIFAIDQAPTGEKDPFGLRRAALGCLRIIIECELPLDLGKCLDVAMQNIDKVIKCGSVSEGVLAFMMERLRRYYLDEGVRADVFNAVLACQSQRPFDFHQRIQAVTEFTKLPEAASLAAANKRILNILRQAGDGDPDIITPAGDGALLTEKAERDLYGKLINITMKIAPFTVVGNYTDALKELSLLREPVDTFFDQVMVMVEDENLRRARLQLLAQIRNEFQQIADISRLQSS